MNLIKEYNTANKQKGNVRYGSMHGGRWVFRCSDKESGALEKMLKVPGGIAVAEKVALVISKSWARTAGKGKSAPDRLDAACRTAIDRLCQIRTLKDWDGETEWWTNVFVDEAVPMFYIKQPVIRKGIRPDDLGLPVVDLEAELVPA